MDSKGREADLHKLLDIRRIFFAERDVKPPLVLFGRQIYLPENEYSHLYLGISSSSSWELNGN